MSLVTVDEVNSLLANLHISVKHQIPIAFQ